ncbi:helix-turn-helix transcriptional regulator [Candidatus Kaiserbacteria bacterium]|nr:helix-turn-helix transcriptional regulator [Candidatus Kaiserbacteria bacterium]
MNYNINAIETKYNGILFRSRLEAKWAAMFDLLRWGWTYEPTDFDGWMPDFAIHGNKIIYVEVKPVTEFPEEVAEKMKGSGCKEQLLILGMITPRCSWTDQPMIGWLSSDCEGFALAPFGRWTGSDRIGFCHSECGFDDRISGKYDGGSWGSGGEVTHDEIDALWREASNRVRWQPKTVVPALSTSHGDIRDSASDKNATETKSPHETRERSKPDGKFGYLVALSKVPMQVIVGKWSKNPDAPRLGPIHFDFLTYLWLHGGPMQHVDEYTVQVEVDPRWGVGRDEYAAIRGKSTGTVARAVADLKAHGLLATRKTRLHEKNPMGQGRTVWIVRLPKNAVADASDIGKARVSDERKRREQFKAWHEGSAPKPAIRTPKYRVERATQAVFSEQADGHTVQETPVSSDNRYGSVDIALLPRLEPLGASVMATYIMLGSFARKHQGWVVSQKRLAADRMRSAATIRRHLVRLRKAGLIETTGTDRKGKWRGSLTYRLLTPAEAS